jgi:hypothetical protein
MIYPRLVTSIKGSLKELEQYIADLKKTYGENATIDCFIFDVEKVKNEIKKTT